MEGASNNICDWIYNNLHPDLIKYITDLQVHTNNDTIQVTNELLKYIEA